MRTMLEAQTRRVLAEPHLPLARYRLDFRAHDRITLPPFQGAVWRSAFGLALKTLSDRAATAGQAADAELYRYFFDTPPPPDATKMRRHDTAPHPYVIAAEPQFRATILSARRDADHRTDAHRTRQ